MKLFLSAESKRSLRKCFRSFKGFAIIDVPGIRQSLGFQGCVDNIYATHIINMELGKLFQSYYKSKRFTAILYLVDELSEELIIDIKEFLNTEHIHITEFNLMECVSEQNHDYIYRYFDTVV